MRERLRGLERVIEVALTTGLALSAVLLLGGLALGAPTPLRWGILLLMVTPVVRVTVVTVGLFFEGDWLFALISLFVLCVLSFGALVAFGPHAPLR